MTTGPLQPRISRRAQGALVVLYLLLLAAGLPLLQGGQWALWLPLWGLALGLSLRRARRPLPPLEWDGQRLYLARAECDFGRSRLWPGLLWLAFADGQCLTLFADQLAPGVYRDLARSIHLAAGKEVI